jgi:anti-sigma B factor antagonist
MSTEAAALRLEGELTIYRAAELKVQWLAAVEAPSSAPTLTFDLSEVTEIDSAGVQLLLLAQRSAAQRQRTLRLVGLSAATQEVFALLDLGAHFGEPAATAA